MAMAKSNRQLYFSSDCETTGSDPGLHQLLSIGTVVLDLDKTILGVFAANLETQPGLQDEPETMRWWKKHPEAYERNTKNQHSPVVVMQAFNDFIRTVQQRFPGETIPTAWPSSFDAKWYQFFAKKYAGEDLLTHSWECIKSTAAVVFGKPFSQISKKDLPPEWSEKLRLTHVGVEDALQQGAEAINLHRRRFGLPEIRGIARHPDRVFVDLSNVTRSLLREGIAPMPLSGERLVHPVLAG